MLIVRFGSLSEVFMGLGNGATDTSGIPRKVVSHLRDLSQALTDVRQIEADEGLSVGSPAALGRMLFHEMARLTRETFRVLYLDGLNRVLDDRTMWTGTVDRVQIHPREIVAAAIASGATALVLAHNHPTSSATPTAKDIAETRRVVDACATIDVIVHDHILVSRTGLFSMRWAGMLDPVSRVAPAAGTPL